MKHGPLLFLGVLSTVLASWLAAVAIPHFQFGDEPPVAIEDLGIEYPQARPGEAQQGAEVYRAQGCNYCHTQQVRQEPLLSDLYLEDPGTNILAVRSVLAAVRPELVKRSLTGLPDPLPRPLLARAAYGEAVRARQWLTNAGASVRLEVVNPSADLRRGWGVRRTVARDYLREQPVMLGQARFGPDLANIGARQTNAMRLYLKLYNACIEMPGSTMPRYPYLFETRPLRPGRAPSPEALAGFGFEPPPGMEVVPKPEARQLVAYLLSLKAEPFFYEVFLPQPPAATESKSAETTNAPPAAPPASKPDAGSSTP